MPETMDTRLSRLRERAERALASGRRGGDVLTVLETMTREAPDGSAHALFAHRHLAELQLSGSPWRAALHLRRLVQAGAADDSAHALMGLSQALLGNYRMAVAAYRRAIKLAPRNPWYHHNLGHLLDVGLSDSVAALEHLRMAHRIQPEEDEIAASLAHCLARLGQLKEAQLMAQRAVRRSPRNREHAALLEWIKSGAPSNVVPSARVDSNGPQSPSSQASVNRVQRRASRSSLDVETGHTSAGASQEKQDKQDRSSHEAREAKETREARGSKEPSSPNLKSARPALKAASPVPSVPSVPSVQSSKATSVPAQSPASLLGSDADEQADGELTPALGRVLSMLEAYGEPPASPAGPAAEESLSASSTRGSHGTTGSHGADDFAAQYLKLARSLWVDFCAQRQPRVQKPAVYAAAVEYTLSKLASRSLTQAQLARRYGVTARAIAARYEEIREALALEPGDPRYVGSAK
jgi:tetratricopeptide (TPR) repeat protein